MSSILNTIKHMIGPSEGYDYFDTDLIIHINSAFGILTQLGVGPTSGFFITDDSAEWSDFVSDARLEMVKTYVFLKVKLAFDPPQNGSLMSSLKEQIAELEWRLNVGVETPAFTGA